MSFNVTPDFLDTFHRVGAKPGHEFGPPPMKKLSMLLRPSFIAPEGKTLVWGDWANIEARVLPWLAASEGAEAKLDIFRRTDADPSLPGVYILTAGDLLGEDALELHEAYKDGSHPKHEHAKRVRQSHGKVPELALGFGGALGALLAMAHAYGVHIDERAGRDMVARWRDANGWARTFWGAHGREGSYGLWGAINSAIENPNTVFTAGRVAYVYDPRYLGGTLMCALPCGTPLIYPSIKWEWREVENKQTGKLEDRYQLTFLKGYGRSVMWYGRAAENVTQAGAASILRRTLKRLDKDWFKSAAGGYSRYAATMPVVMHTHDEVVTETPEWAVDQTARALKHLMERSDDWAEGLPLAAEITSSWFYSKAAKEMKL